VPGIRRWVDSVTQFAQLSRPTLVGWVVSQRLLQGFPVSASSSVRSQLAPQNPSRPRRNAAQTQPDWIATRSWRVVVALDSAQNPVGLAGGLKSIRDGLGPKLQRTFVSKHLNLMLK
jgi:hypothetical protein